MDYIVEKKKKGCIFCKKPKEGKDKENLILYQGDYAFIIMNKFPYNNGHLMVAPYRHVGGICDLTDAEMLAMMKLVRLGVEVLSAAMDPDGFNIGINLGKVAGAGIADHIHVHVVPRWHGDTNFMPVVADTKVMPQALQATYEQLRKALESGAGGFETDD